MIDFTVELGRSYNVLPFEIFRQDKDEVIMLINYYIEKSEETDSTGITAEGVQQNDKENDKENDKAFWSLL